MNLAVIVIYNEKKNCISGTRVVMTTAKSGIMEAGIYAGQHFDEVVDKVFWNVCKRYDESVPDYGVDADHDNAPDLDRMVFETTDGEYTVYVEYPASIEGV